MSGMKILLDTHVLLWWLAGDRRLPAKAKQVIENPHNNIVVSSVNIWEIVVKHALGRIAIELPELEVAITDSGFLPLDITAKHAIEVGNLPMYHRDPFDRMLIAQCIVERAHLLTHDSALSEYGKVAMLV